MSSWARRTAGFRRGLSENFGFRGSKVVLLVQCQDVSLHECTQPALRSARSQNLAAWSVAGILTYYVWIKPERQAAEERQAGPPPRSSCLSV